MITFTATHIDVSVLVATALAAFASKDDTRPNLGVGVDKAALGATDGHRLALFPSEGCTPIHAAHYQGRVWPRAYVETAIKVAKATKAASVRLELDKAGSGFPPAWQVVPDYGMQARDSVGVNPAYLADLVKVQKACDAPRVELSQVNGELDPIGFTVPGHEHTARVVIMPVRK